MRRSVASARVAPAATKADGWTGTLAEDMKTHPLRTFPKPSELTQLQLGSSMITCFAAETSVSVSSGHTTFAQFVQHNDVFDTQVPTDSRQRPAEVVEMNSVVDLAGRQATPARAAVANKPGNRRYARLFAMPGNREEAAAARPGPGAAAPRGLQVVHQGARAPAEGVRVRGRADGRGSGRAGRRWRPPLRGGRAGRRHSGGFRGRTPGG